MPNLPNSPENSDIEWVFRKRRNIKPYGGTCAVTVEADPAVPIWREFKKSSHPNAAIIGVLSSALDEIRQNQDDETQLQAFIGYYVRFLGKIPFNRMNAVLNNGFSHLETDEGDMEVFATKHGPHKFSVFPSLHDAEQGAIHIPDGIRIVEPFVPVEQFAIGGQYSNVVLLS